MDDDEFKRQTGLEPIKDGEAERWKIWILEKVRELPAERRRRFIEDLNPFHRQMLYTFGMPRDLGDAAALEKWLAS